MLHNDRNLRNLIRDAGHVAWWESLKIKFKIFIFFVCAIIGLLAFVVTCSAVQTRMEKEQIMHDNFCKTQPKSWSKC